MNTLVPTSRTSTPWRASRLLGLVVSMGMAITFATGCASQKPSAGERDEPLTSNQQAPLEAKYAEALDDPANLLSRPSVPYIGENLPRGGLLRRAASAPYRGFNWLTESGANVQELQTYVHDNFAVRDRNEPGRWIPRLAYKVTVSSDQTTYTVHLREGVKWHIPRLADLSRDSRAWLAQERELTAEDCVFYFDMVKNPQVQAGALKAYYGNLKGAEVIDKYTFKVEWKKKVRHSRAFTLGAYPLPKWLFTRKKDGSAIPAATVGTEFNGHWASKLAVGTGPYMLTAYEPNQVLRIDVNPNYWDTKPAIPTIEFHVVRDPETQFLKLRAGELDVLAMPPGQLTGDPDAAAAIADSDSFSHRVVDLPAYYYLGWNIDGHFFDDKRVRQAMSHAFNRKAVMEGVLGGLAGPITGPILPGHPGNDPQIEPLGFDLERAKALLDQAGWTDSDGDGVRDKLIDGTRQKFEFSMLGYDTPTTRSCLALYKEDLRKVGVIMTTKYVSWSLMQERMDRRNFDAFTGGWALGWEVDPFQIWHSSQADVPKGSNRVGFRHDRADEIIETLRVTFDAEKRTQLLREFHRIIHEEQPYTFLYQIKRAYAWRSNLKNVEFKQIRPVDLSLSWHFAEPDESKADDAGQATESQ